MNASMAQRTPNGRARPLGGLLLLVDERFRPRQLGVRRKGPASPTSLSCSYAMIRVTICRDCKADRGRAGSGDQGACDPLDGDPVRGPDRSPGREVVRGGAGPRQIARRAVGDAVLLVADGLVLSPPRRIVLVTEGEAESLEDRPQELRLAVHPLLVR